ncbi:MAG: hypothetical protein ACYDEB_11165 [Dehalococcoidia bacterium]
MRTAQRGDAFRVVAVDWSGARTGAEKRIWLAEVIDGALLRLECGRDRDAMAAHLIALARDPRPMVVGLDFAFSMPAWYLRRLGVRDAQDLWARASVDGERWLAACEPPFWGRPGKPRPALRGAFRVTESTCAAVGGVRPKSVFQIGGAGAVGTGSLRGMPLLLALHRAGLSIWPFDAPAAHSVVEIYPRVFTGPVAKSRADARVAHLRAHFGALPPPMLACAASSEDAFDAAVSALRMWEYRDALASLHPARDPLTQLEGAIWLPGSAPGAAAESPS